MALRRDAAIGSRFVISYLIGEGLLIQRRAFLLASVALVAVPGSLFAKPRIKGAAQTISLSGARAPVEVVEDELGVPHVRAASLHDAFFGQGYLVARDRLFQIDMEHRRDMGRMAEAFGPRFVAADKAARLFLYRGDIDAELAALPADVLECARGYVAGVNARIAELAADPAQLPLEYGILGISPMRWEMADLVRNRGIGMGRRRRGAPRTASGARSARCRSADGAAAPRLVLHRSRRARCRGSERRRPRRPRSCKPPDGFRSGAGSIARPRTTLD
jgi:hypothetical protein